MKIFLDEAKLSHRRLQECLARYSVKVEIKNSEKTENKDLNFATEQLNLTAEKALIQAFELNNTLNLLSLLHNSVTRKEDEIENKFKQPNSVN